MAKEAKFNFIEEKQIDKVQQDTGFYVTVMKTCSIYFPKEMVNVFDMDKMIIKLYADTEKKVLGWKFFKKGDLHDLKGIRQLKVNNTTGAMVVMVNKLLNKLGINKDNILDHIGRKKIQVYKSSYFDGEMYYIDLK